MCFWGGICQVTHDLIVLENIGECSIGRLTHDDRNPHGIVNSVVQEAERLWYFIAVAFLGSVIIDCPRIYASGRSCLQSPQLESRFTERPREPH